MVELVKLSFSLDKELYDTLVTLSEERGVSVTETIRTSIATEDYVDKLLKQGRVLVIGPGQETFELFSTHH